MSVINQVVLYVPDPTKGRPLFYGQVFVGKPDYDPEIPVNQKQLNVVQEDGTILPVAQPFILGAGGTPVYEDSNVLLDVNGDYSIKILDKNGDQVYYFHNIKSSNTGELIVNTELVETPVTLTAGQLDVTFPNALVSESTIYISKESGDRGRLFSPDDYTITGDYSILLTESYDAGTICLAVSGEVAEVGYSFVKDAPTVESAASDIRILINDAYNIEEYRSGGGGGGMWDVVNTDDVTPNGYNIVTSTAAPSLSLKLRVDGKANVKQFGAYGDLVNDDTSAIQAAFDDYDVIHFPKGKYLTSDTLTLSNRNIELTGEHSGIYFTGSGDCLSIIEDGFNLYKINNLDFFVNNAPNGQVAIHYVGTGQAQGGDIILERSRIRLEVVNCRFDNVDNSNHTWITGLLLEDCHQPTVHDCSFRGSFNLFETGLDTAAIRWLGTVKPADAQIHDNRIAYFDKGIQTFATEGLWTNGITMLPVSIGYYMETTEAFTTNGKPGLTVMGSHISPTVKSIYTDRQNDPIITNNLLFSGTEGAVEIRGATIGTINNNIFATNIGGTTVTLGKNAADIPCNNVVISNNVFQGQQHSVYFAEGCQNCVAKDNSSFSLSGDQYLQEIELETNTMVNTDSYDMYLLALTSCPSGTPTTIPSSGAIERTLNLVHTTGTDTWTVRGGLKVVQVNANIGLTPFNDGAVSFSVMLNGATVAGGSNNKKENTNQTIYLGFQSGPIEVVGGDELQIIVTQDSGGSVDTIVTGQSFVSFSAIK